MAYSSPSAVKTAPRSFNSPGELCTTCAKRVYHAERTTGPGGKPFHRACLKCHDCQKTLAPGNVLEHESMPYCKPCHSKAFGPKGFGFGGSMSGDYVDRYSPVHAAPKATSTRSSADILADAQAAIDSPLRSRGTAETHPGDTHASSPLRESIDVAFNKLDVSSPARARTPVKKPEEERVKTPTLLARSNSGSGSPATTFTFGGAPDRCRRCGDVVYFAEQINAAGNKWHKRCLRCAKCSKSLDSHLKVSDDQPYCTKCHAEISGIAEQGFALRPSMF